jgi:caspase domain-containing protein
MRQGQRMTKTKLSLRRLWKLYRAVSMQHHSHTRRELILLQEAFYSGARGVHELGPLRNPIADGQLVASALRNAGFNVTYLKNLKDEQFRATLRQLARNSAKADGPAC